jgi:small conductance mechanosensitive channel
MSYSIDFEHILEMAVDWVVSSGVTIVIVIILGLIALKVARIVANRVLGVFLHEEDDIEAKKRADTLGSLIRYVLNVSIVGVVLVMILGELGVEIGPILAAAGVLGLAVGFGAQSLVKDVLAGFFIILDDQIRVGDVVNVADKGGLVERVTLRLVILRDLAGNVHYVPCGQISVVTNMTKEFSQYVFDIGVAYRENVDEVFKVIKEVGADLRSDKNFSDDIIDDIEILGLDKFADSAVVIKARVKTRPIKQWRVAREFNRRLKAAFDARNIEIPFPHVTLYPGQDKDGSAPALHVSQQKDSAAA